MLLSQSKIHNKYLFGVLAQDKIRSFHVSMDEIPVVYFLDGF